MVPILRPPAVDTLATIRQRGVLRVGVVQVAPMVMLDRSNTHVGYSVDLARRLAADLGARIAVSTDPAQHPVAKARFARATVTPVEDDPLLVVTEGRAHAAVVATLSADAVVATAPRRAGVRRRVGAEAGARALPRDHRPAPPGLRADRCGSAAT